MIVEFEKVGRVFYGGSNGHVNELIFKDCRGTFRGLFMNNGTLKMTR